MITARVKIFHSPTEEELNEFIKNVDFNDMHVSGNIVHVTYWVDEEEDKLTEEKEELVLLRHWKDYGSDTMSFEEFQKEWFVCADCHNPYPISDQACLCYAR